MSLAVLISILIRLAALAWSIVVLRRIRDRRMLFLAAILALMVVRQVLALASSLTPGRLTLWDHPEELTSLVLSVMAFLAIFVVERILGERRQAEAERETLVRELDAKNAELERFAYTVSHDLKSPLITLRGFLGFLEKDAAEGSAERLRHDLDRIRAATDTMGRLLDELLELSRIGRLMNPPEEVRLTDVAREAVELLAGPIAEAGAEVQIDPWLPRVEGDRQRLVQIYQNLIENAVKFRDGSKPPRIEIGRRQQDGDTVLWVRDNGIGIDPRYQDRVFRLFERLEPETFDGTGIGLPLVQRIVEVHGGRLWVESEGTGRGATFCFTLAPAGG